MKKIAIIGLEKNDGWDFFSKLEDSAKSLDCEFVPLIYCHKEDDLYDQIKDKGFKPGDFVAAVSVGGDGTFLYASRVFAGTDVPIFGVNKGRVGFNTTIEEKELLDYIHKLLKDEAVYNYKNLLEVEIEGIKDKYLVLNEGVVSHTGISRMVRLKVDVTEHSVCDFRGDGLIISSPTGSTAYNLSAGGPILHPSVNAFVVCPICPHTLAIRPYIIPFGETITVTVLESPGKPQITLDGQKIIILEIGQKIHFKKSDKFVKIVKGSKSFSEILETKLGWKV